MKIKYDREVDIITIDQGDVGDKIAYGEEMGPLIAHFTEEGKLVLLEILEASDFLAVAIKAMALPKEEQIVEVP